MSLSTQVMNHNKAANHFMIVPNNVTEAMNLAKMIADSNFCPKDIKGKAGDVLVAMQMGAEIGLSPMQSLQNIAVINSRPTIWGDAALAVVLAHPSYVSHREWFEGSIDEGNLTAYCGITRRNSEEYIKSFSMNDAKKAGLWTKQGVWQQYPNRMLQMRARAFAIRDKFADALRGINIREEVEDYKIEERKVSVITPKNESKVIDIKSIEIDPPKKDEFAIDGMLLDISQASSLEDLEKIYKTHYKTCISNKDRESLEKLMVAKDEKKTELNVKEFNEEYGEVE